MTEAPQLHRTRQLKQKWPAYGPLLDFYLAVRQAQNASRPEVCISNDRAAMKTDEDAGLPDQILMGRNGFPIDIEASHRLFMDLCRVGKAANEYFSAQVRQIEECLSSDTLDLATLLARGCEGQAIKHAADEVCLDEGILSFLVTNSVRPSIELARDELTFDFKAEIWKQVHCPVCGSLPTISLLQGEPVKRFSLCSQCAFQWPVDRLSCSVCGDSDNEARSYFHDEGEERHRIDVCDRCNHYIKTIDLSDVETADPCLEDLATLHLDVIAVEKGYSRVVANAWSE
ncbi:MAG: formate dehydrogenase accessory protein FdhE [Hyphomicrobiaceae bacterium]